MTRRKGIGYSVAAFAVIVIAAAGASNIKLGSRADGAATGATLASSAAIGGSGINRGKATVAQVAERHIVVFSEPALAAYRGGLAGLPAPARNGAKSRMDVHSAPAKAYVDYLRKRQAAYEADMGRALGRAPVIAYRMQHALNSVVATLTPAEADVVSRMRGVRLVEAYREYAVETDTGPVHIGAGAVWSGAAAGSPYQGEGMVAAILDSGINFGSPSFTGVDPVDGYQHVNPLGAGNYLGTCAAGGIDEGRCNDKLIGGYDFVCGAPGNTCGVPNIREEPGFGDTSSHGSHVASTVAGNRRVASYNGTGIPMSGVAPRASIVALDICYTNTATGQGLCPNVSALAAVNQVVADGLADVINYSIGGGGQPWSESVSLAFLNAVDAGVYVASSAGNSGPGANTLGHVEPWVSASAAAQHGRADFAYLMQVTGPGTVPEPLTAMVLSAGAGGVGHTAPYPANTPLRVSAGIDTAADACTALTPGLFAGAIAVVRRGTCSFTIKVDNAAAAGAVAVVIANNAVGAILPSVPGTTVPAFGLDQASGNALRDFNTANPVATATIGYPASPVPNTADALASFSSRGPAGSFNLLKPDTTAPGVNILAVTAGTTISGFENQVGLMSGTSMASPHHAGAVALVRQARPGWTVPEVKSALAMTATREVFLEDTVTPANAFAAGSGRIRVDQAILAGLVMHETTANYSAANPTQGGDPAALNQPSMANRNCQQTCSFTRTFRNVTGRAQIWAPKLSGLSGRVTPLVTKVKANDSVTFTVTIDSSALPNNGSWSFGNVQLKASGLRGGQTDPVLNLPVAIAVQAP